MSANPPAADAQAPIVALVGGGVSVAALFDELTRTLPIERLRLRLVARDFDRVGAIARQGQHLADQRPGWQVEACRSLPDAVDGATLVVLMLRVGGLEARRADELLARSFGLPGDEGLGPGGAANALRTLPVVDHLARDLVRLAPDATVLNLVAPLGLTTRVLVDHGLDTIGVCELPGVTEQSLRSTLDGTTRLAYAGFNHLGWFWPVDEHGARRPDGTQLLEPAVAAGLVDRAVLERYEAAPLKYHYWLHDPDAAGRLGIARDPDRSEVLIDLRDRARTELATRPDQPSDAVLARPTPWFRHALVPIMASLLGGAPWQGYANVRNGTLVPCFDPDVVVEVPAQISAEGIAPEPLVASMPPAALAFSRQVERSEQLLHAAWNEQDPALVEQSFVQGPHQLDQEVARRLAFALAAATRPPAPSAERSSSTRPRRTDPPVTIQFETRPTTSTDYVVGCGSWHDDRVDAALAGRPVVSVVDREVARCHGPAIDERLADLDCIARLDLRGGEQCKTQEQLEALLGSFEACALPKHGVVLAIGGGTISDVVGLAALLMRRSVPLVLLPTTLLAQVDAAVGGKNGINSPTSKNMIGHFHHPLVVASDPHLLQTLDTRQMVGGIAECIKVFAVADRDALDEHRPALVRPDLADPDRWTPVIAAAQEVKLRLLADDPYEASSMRLLNYGHAFAHLLEERSGFELMHGEAVLLGMLIENEVSMALGLATDGVADLQEMIIDLVPPEATRHWLAFEHVEPDLDKVRQMRRSTMNLVCVTELGDAVIVDDTGDGVLAAAWRNAEDRLRDASRRTRALT